MAQGEMQRLKLLYLMQILYRETDDCHGLTIREITEKLNARGVTADRKTLYSDLNTLRDFNVDIVPVKEGRDTYYHIGSRMFELPELKLLVDIVQSAKFLSERKSRELIGKIESLGSEHDEKHLQRQVWISGRIKTMNESIYYSVDALHEAIGSNRQVRFHYCRWNMNKQMELRRKGEWYEVSPWGLMWDDENYYLVAFDEKDGKIKHYRVDKMMQIQTLNKARAGSKEFKEFDLPKYTKSLFGMYGGEPMSVTLEGRNDLVGVVIDRFGKDIMIRKKDEEHFIAHVNVTVSRQFLGWVFAVGAGLRITGPASVAEMMHKEAEKLLQLYT